MYWLVSLPLLETEDRTWNILQQKTTYEADLSINYRFTLPELRVGTLDSLLVLSDDLVKVNSQMEAVVNKIRRQLFDMQAASYSDSREELTVDGIPPDNYLERFTWDSAKYPPRRPLQDTAQAITETIAKLEDDLKVRVSEYNQLKGQLTAAARKATGSLAVRDLTGIVKPEHCVDTENLTTLYVVVPKHQKGEWLTNYEGLCDFIVPRSSGTITEDSDYALMTVVLFKRVADTFKSAARAKGYQVREYDCNIVAANGSSDQSRGLRAEVENKRAQLEQWCSTAYGEAFSAWIHVCAIRLFTESILRYGLPPRFLAVLMKPGAKQQAKLRKLLAQTFGSSGTTKYFENDGSTAPAGAAAGGEGEMFPYVSFTINIDA